MKFSFAIFFCMATAAAAAQPVKIEGTAFDSTHGRVPVSIVRNDTLVRFRERGLRDWKGYQELVKDKNYVTQTDKTGRFVINADRNDSIFFKSWRHITKVYSIGELMTMRPVNIVLEPEVCIPYFECEEQSQTHLVFVGEKIKLDVAPDIYYCNRIPFDSEFDCLYRIQDKIYGNYDSTTIAFTAYDHYGRPAFGTYDNVLLFMSRYCGKWFHQKYQYYPLYKTTDGRWAAPYPALDYKRLDSNSRIKPEIIPFANPVETDLKKIAADRIQELFPAPYYKIENGKAIAVYGNYVKELVELKKETVLKARGVVME